MLLTELSLDGCLNTFLTRARNEGRVSLKTKRDIVRGREGISGMEDSGCGKRLASDDSTGGGWGRELGREKEREGERERERERVRFPPEKKRGHFPTYQELLSSTLISYAADVARALEFISSQNVRMISL